MKTLPEIQDLYQTLAAQPFFQGLDETRLRSLTGCARAAGYPAGQYLLRQGEPAEHFYILLQGHVRLSVYSPRRGAVTIQTVGPSEPLGWSWLYPPFSWHFDGVAVEPVEAILFDAQCLRGRMEADFALGYPLLKKVIAIMSQRLQAARLQLLDIYEDNA